ncbi:hypothetical protein ABIA69_003118 [Lysinibacillus parviboronicapiens]|uniref:NERD domain-containing protein n=1 Tax=Lysinibacillus parviboronicapiens TaxID=436516 RepID=A0ABV2PMV4_9BACI
MKTFFLLLLGIIYLMLANAMEVAIVRGIYFYIGLGLLTVGIFRYVKGKYRSFSRNAALKRQSEEELMNIPHTQCTISSDCLHALLLNEPTNTLLLANRADWEAEVTKKEIQFQKIYEVSIVEDDNIIIASTRNGLLSGSLIDGEQDPLPDADDLQEETDDTVSQIALKIVVDNLSTPILEYVFMANNKPISREEDAYSEALELCEQWYRKISIIIKRYELERVPIRNWH